MLWLHPLLEAAAIVLAVYALALGYVRFKVQHRGVKGVVFAWKQHVRFGTLAVAGWMAGLLLGLTGTWISWNAVMVTGWHSWVAAAMIPLMLFGYASGRRMDTVKKRRNVLPLAHGICNAVLTVMAASQAATGVSLVRDVLLP